MLADSGWHQGVVGIVASRLSEKLCMPCFMICLDRGMGKGSCRSYGGVNLFQALSDCAPLLEGFGGHALAAGFTVREENIPALAQSLRRAVAGQLKGTVPLSVLRADAAVTSDLLTVENIQALDLLEPCGTGNPRPVLVVKGALVQSMNQVGRGRHLKLRLESRGVPLDAIFLYADGGQLHQTPRSRVDVAFYPQINEFRGQRSAQLQVLDLRTAPSRAQQERLAVEKYFRGEELSPEESRPLLPRRTDFVALWRWLERQSARCGVIQDSPERIARGVARISGQPEMPARTFICLKVMEERGLIDLDGGEQLSITLRQVEHKVDLEGSAILVRLRRFTEQ